MNAYFRSLYYGIATALIFIGLFGFAIDDSASGVSLGLIVVGSITAVITYATRELR